MNYPDSIRFLYSLGNELKTAKLDLARIAILLEGNLRRLAIVQLRDLKSRVDPVTLEVLLREAHGIRDRRERILFVLAQLVVG